MIEYISALVGLEVNLSGSLDGTAPQSWLGAGDWQQHYSDKQDLTKILQDGNFKCTASRLYINRREGAEGENQAVGLILF